MSGNPLGSAEKRSSISCIVSGVIFILLGAKFVDSLAREYRNHSINGVVVYFFIAGAFIFLGIFQLTAKQREKRREEAIATPGTRANRRYEEKRAKAVEKQNNKLYAHGDIKDEIFKGNIITTAIGSAIAVVIGLFFFYLYFYGQCSNEYLAFLIIGMVFVSYGIGVIVYSYHNSGNHKIKDIINKLGLDYEKVNEDFIGGKCFKIKSKLICIGNRYTVYSAGTYSTVFDNSDICEIAPHRQDTYHYTNLIYTGKQSTYYVAVTLKNGSTYYLSCRQFIDEMIIEEYLNQSRNSIYSNQI